MSKFKSVCLVSIIVLVLGCTHTVTLTVKNALPATPPPPNLNISAITKDSHGATDNTIHLGTAGPNQQVSSSFKVKDSGSYAVRGDLSSGVTVFSGGDKTITKDTTDAVEIAKLDARIIDPSDTSAIHATFSRLGADVGFNPTTVQSAVSSIFGGLVYYVDAVGNTPGADPVVIVSPAQLTGSVDFATFQWPSGHETQDATISTDHLSARRPASHCGEASAPSLPQITFTNCIGQWNSSAMFKKTTR